MQNNENKVICLCPEIDNRKISYLILYTAPSHKNLEKNQSVFGSYLWVYFSRKSVCRFLFSYILEVLLYF